MSDITMCANYLGCQVNGHCRRSIRTVELMPSYESWGIFKPTEGENCFGYWPVPTEGGYMVIDNNLPTEGAVNNVP